MAEVLEVPDLHLRTLLPVIEVIDELGGLVEENQFHVEGIADALDMGEELIAVLFRSRDISGPVDQPRDLRAGNLLLDLLNPNPRGADPLRLL